MRVSGTRRNDVLTRLGIKTDAGKLRKRRMITLSVVTSLILGGIVNTAGPAGVSAAPVGAGFDLEASDLAFILKQVQIAENHVDDTTVATGPCGTLLGDDPDQIPEVRLPFGLRTVDGTCNHLGAGTQKFGAADTIFQRLTTPVFRAADPFDPDGEGPIPPVPGTTTYNSLSGVVSDSDPRMISNLIVDQTVGNPAAVTASGGCFELDGDTCFTGNVAPDAGLSAPFNSMFTFFGQFFDHGLDLVNKGGSGTVFVPVQPDDELYIPGLDGPDDDFGANCGGPRCHARMQRQRVQLPHPDPRTNIGGNRTTTPPDHGVRRPEPDLHVAPVAPGVPA